MGTEITATTGALTSSVLVWGTCRTCVLVRITTAGTGIATAGTGIATAGTGIATAGTGIATAGTGIATAGTGIAASTGGIRGVAGAAITFDVEVLPDQSTAC